MGIHLKGQVAIEFMTLVGLIALISITVISATTFYLKDFRGDEAYDDLKKIGDKIRTEVYMASTVEDGYYREFYLTNNTNYSITRSNKTILITTPEKTHSTHVEVDFIGTIQRGWNNISKQGGLVYVN